MNNKLKEGETLFADGKIDEAEKCFLSLIENDSDGKEAYNNLGVIAFQQDDKAITIDNIHQISGNSPPPICINTVLSYASLFKNTVSKTHLTKVKKR